MDKFSFIDIIVNIAIIVNNFEILFFPMAIFIKVHYLSRTTRTQFQIYKAIAFFLRQ